MGSIWSSISFFCLHKRHRFIRVHPCLIEWEVLRNFPHCLTNGEIHQGRRPRDSSIFGQKQHDNSNLDIRLYKENALPRNLSTNLASKLPRIDTKDKNIDFYRYIKSWILWIYQEILTKILTKKYWWDRNWSKIIKMLSKTSKR